jgi:hypothetical protein
MAGVIIPTLITDTVTAAGTITILTDMAIIRITTMGMCTTAEDRLQVIEM